MLVRELVEGQEIDQVLLVRDRAARGGRAAAPQARRPHGLRRARPCARTIARLLRAGRRGARDRPLRCPRAARGRVRALRPAAEGEYDLDELLDGPPRSATGMEADLRELHRDGAGPAPAGAAGRACSGRTRRRGAGSATRRPPSATTRPTATGCSSTASRSPRPCRRSRRPSRGSTATSRSPARCCTTSASSRPTRPTRWRST